MALHLVAPHPPRCPNYSVRGVLHGVKFNRSCQTSDKKAATKLMNGWRDQIERGEISGKQELTLLEAILSYGRAGHPVSIYFLPAIKFLGERFLARDLDQPTIDKLAVRLLPNATNATRNRHLYSPLKAALKHAGVVTVIKRPADACGKPRRIFLREAQREGVIAAAFEVNQELGCLMTLLIFTGLRLGEALSIKLADIDLAEQTIFIPDTKNGFPRQTYLPSRVIVALANHPAGLTGRDRLFTFSQKSGDRNPIYRLAYKAYAAAGVSHGGAPFHVCRHTFGQMMTKQGADLCSTGAWKSRSAASVYEHFDVSEEAKRIDSVPGATVRLIVGPAA
jgi:integrase